MLRTRRLLPALLAAVSLTGAAWGLAPVAAASGWTPLSAYSLPSGADSGSAQVGYQSGGTATVASVQDGSLQVQSLNPGGVYASQAQFSDSGGSAPSLAVAADGAAVLAWSAPAGDYASYRAAGGATWSTPVALGQSQATVTAAIGPGDVAVVGAVTALAGGGYGAIVLSQQGSGWAPLPASGAAFSKLAGPDLALGFDGAGDLQAAFVTAGAGTGGSQMRVQQLPSGAASWAPAAPTSLSGQPLGLYAVPESVGSGSDEALYMLYSGDCGLAVATATNSLAPVFSGSTCLGANAAGGQLIGDGVGDVLALWPGAGQLAGARLDSGGGPLIVADNIPTTVQSGVPATFDATFADLWSTVGQVSWNFGDDTAITDGAQASHAWGGPGIFTVTVSATDALGIETSNSFQVNVLPGPSGASVTPTVTPSPLLLRATQSRARWTLVRGTVFTLALNRRADVTLVFARRGKGAHASAAHPLGVVSTNVAAGRHRIDFHGVLTAKRKLAPGRYTVTFVAGIDGVIATPVKLDFTVRSGAAPTSRKHARRLRHHHRSR